MRRVLLLLLWFCSLLPAGQAAPAFLFDATKAETAGNADWVIDEDNHVAGRYPTPPASGITAATAETYWTGALSSWGVALVRMGYNVEQLPVGGRITYGDSTNAQDLSNYQVYVVCEPNILFTAAEKLALIRFVQAGGSLFVISDHNGSDRNNDGYDSVAIWNDFFSNNGVQANPFGVTINATDVSLVSTDYDPAADDPLTNGPLGPATVLEFDSAATITLSTAANPTARAAFWTSATHTNSNVMMAWGTYGAGRFVVETDSSPLDDGTGSSGHTLYYGWTEQGVNHPHLFLNASVWLASVSTNGVPSNDNFTNAATLGLAATGASGTNVNATKEAGEPNHAGIAGGASVWWQFTAVSSGAATITTAGSSFDTLLAVYTGTSVGALTAVASNDNADGSHTTSAVTFPVTAGTTYHVAVDGANGATGHITLTTAFPAPPNDNFANATPVSFNATGTASLTLTGNNVNATAEPGEPNHAGYVGGCSVWWTWTAPTSGGVTISTLNSNFDTLLAVYTGTSVGALTAVATNANYGSSLQSLVSFNAGAGTTYRIAVDGYAGATGNVALNFSPGNANAAPANDNFAQAAVLTGTSATATGTNVGATLEAGETSPFYGGGHSVWWTWTAPANLYATVSTYGSSFDTTLAVETGTAVNALTLVGSNDDYTGTTSQVSFNALAGTTYAIRVDGYSTYTGNVALALTTQPLPTVSVEATTPQAAEAGQVPGVFTFTLSQAAATALTINFNWAGTATTGADYSAANVGYATGPTVTIPAGQTRATVTVTPVDDNDPTEGTETIITSLVAGSGYQVSATAATATVFIQDDSPYSSAWESIYRPLGFSGALAAPLADPDGDGIPNLLKFAFNLNPLAADNPAGLPVLGTGRFADASGTMRRFPTLTFTCRTDAPNLVYAVETTTDLAAGNWTAATAVFVSATTANMPANTEQVVYRAPLPLDGPDAAPQQFMRVRVTGTSTSAAPNAASSGQPRPAAALRRGP